MSVLEYFYECERCGEPFLQGQTEPKRCKACQRFRNCQICGKEFNRDEVHRNYYCSTECAKAGSVTHTYTESKTWKEPKKKKNEKPEENLNRCLEDMKQSGFGFDYGAYMAAR